MLDLFDRRWQAVLVASASMVVVSYIAIGVSPRTLGRQHPAPIALVAARFVHPLARVLGPLPQLLILVGNALTPGKGLPRRARSRPRPSCASWSTWPRRTS